MRTDDRTEEQVQIMQAQRGDPSAFQELLGNIAPSAYALALGMTGDAASAEKAFSGAVLSLWKTLPSFPLDENLSAHLHALTLQAVSELLPPPEKKPEWMENQAKTLLSCLGSLSEGHRSILLLREIGNLSWEEIGRALQLTPGTAESRWGRAMEELKQSFFAGEENSSVSLTELLHQVPPLPEGMMESLLASAAAQPQDLPFTNLPQDRDIHAVQRARLKAWRRPILIVAALVVCFLLILGIGRLAQTLAG